MSVRPVNPLVRCPRCSSRLISPLQADGCHDGVIVDRHCPECGHRDRVVTTTFAAAVWARHETRVAASMRALADALADGAPIEVSDILVEAIVLSLAGGAIGVALGFGASWAVRSSRRAMAAASPLVRAPSLRNTAET